jgi:hypothetical protein
MRTRGQRRNYLALHDGGYGSEALSEDRPDFRWYQLQYLEFTNWKVQSVNLVPQCSPSQPEMSAFGLLDGVGISLTDSDQQSNYEARREIIFISYAYTRRYISVVRLFLAVNNLLPSRLIYAVMSLQIANNCEYSQPKIPANIHNSSTL